MPSTDLKIGIIGAGRIGRVHAENLSTQVRQAQPAAITDIILSAAQQTAKANNIPIAGQDYRQILDDPSIAAVLICSSTDTHAQLIEESAQAGKHIFCEKPITLDLKKVRHVLKTVEACGVKFQIGFNRRFDRNFARLRQLLAEGKIGVPHILRITSRDPAPPPLEYVKVSGGIFLDMTVHDFDMARFLMQSEVAEVYAVGEALVDPKVRDFNDIDTAIITLEFENGAIGTIDNSRQAVYGYDQRVEVFGSKGMVRADNATPDDLELLTEAGVVSSKPHYFFLERYRDAYVAEVQAFVDAILADTEPPVTGVDGMAPLKIGLAARKSYQEKRAVRLDEIQG
ncbi:MAG: inositol 2-dehydrogenase [bacterium]